MCRCPSRPRRERRRVVWIVQPHRIGRRGGALWRAAVFICLLASPEARRSTVAQIQAEPRGTTPSALLHDEEDGSGREDCCGKESANNASDNRACVALLRRRRHVRWCSRR